MRLQKYVAATRAFHTGLITETFEVHALDYVLKPVDPDRLREAIDHAASTLSLRRAVSLADRLEGLLSEARRTIRDGSAPAPPVPERFAVHDADDRVSLLDVDHIEWFESAGNYVQLHSRGRSYLMRTTMDRVAQRLATREWFIRIRRSAIVNVRAVASLEHRALRTRPPTAAVRSRTNSRLVRVDQYHRENNEVSEL